MREFRLREGERELLREQVIASRNGKQVPRSKLVVTDHRIALLVPKPDVFSKLFGALVNRMASEMAERLELVHEITRARFEAVEDHGDMLVFRNDQAGYAHVSFEVYQTSPFAVWQQRTRDWIAGNFETIGTPA